MYTLEEQVRRFGGTLSSEGNVVNVLLPMATRYSIEEVFYSALCKYGEKNFTTHVISKGKGDKGVEFQFSLRQIENTRVLESK